MLQSLAQFNYALPFLLVVHSGTCTCMFVGESIGWYVCVVKNVVDVLLFSNYLLSAISSCFRLPIRTLQAHKFVTLLNQLDIHVKFLFAVTGTVNFSLQ